MRKSTIVAGIIALLGIGIIGGCGLDSEPTPAPTQTATILGAINLMKPGFNGRTSDAERQLHEQLVSAGYSYWVTYDDGTERINRKFTKNGKAYTVAFTIPQRRSHERLRVRSLDQGLGCLVLCPDRAVTR